MMQRDICCNEDHIKFDKHKAELELMHMNAKFAAAEDSKDASYAGLKRERDEKVETYNKKMKMSYFGTKMVSLAPFLAYFYMMKL